jgi:hypothetical protein
LCCRQSGQGGVSCALGQPIAPAIAQTQGCVEGRAVQEQPQRVGNVGVAGLRQRIDRAPDIS